MCFVVAGMGPFNPSMPSRISSPPASGSGDMLRNILLTPSSQLRPRANSSTSSGGGGASSQRRRYSSDGSSSTPSRSSSRTRGRGLRRSGGGGNRSASPKSPLPPVSPASSMELRVCSIRQAILFTVQFPGL